MVKLNAALLVPMLAALFLLASSGGAEAKRFGGGRSFGGKSIYSVPYQRSQLQPRRATPPSKATRTNQAARQSWRNRGGLTGWLAPFLIGGLLGSLFFGTAFEHLNLADLLVVGGLALIAIKLFARRSHQPVGETLYPGATAPHARFRQDMEESGATPFDTNLLFGPNARDEGTGSLPSLVTIPAGFDVPGFLDEAKQIFKHLQAAWNDGELADIRGLTTDEVFMEIKDQKEAEGKGPATEMLALEAQLLDYRETADTEEAAVLFSALLKEGERAPEPIEEIWHFVRSKHRFKPSWVLDGIQQIEA